MRSIVASLIFSAVLAQDGNSTADDVIVDDVPVDNVETTNLPD
jgi:hypothetical protein